VLVYTRSELNSILEDFFTAFTVQEFKDELRELADEKKIAERIEAKQREILASHNINPDQGMRDLARVRKVYAADKEILEKLIIVAGKEEALTNEVLGVSDRFRTPNTMQQMQQMLKNFPQMLGQLQQQVQQNPQILTQMTPQQQAQYHYLVAMARQVQQPTQFQQQPTFQQPTQFQQPQFQQPTQFQQQPTFQQTTQFQQPTQVQQPTFQQTTQFQQPQFQQPQFQQPQFQQPQYQQQPQGILGSFFSMLGFGSAPPVGRTMKKDDELD